VNSVTPRQIYFAFLVDNWMKGFFIIFLSYSS
jgi:hypothetical protein